MVSESEVRVMNVQHALSKGYKVVLVDGVERGSKAITDTSNKTIYILKKQTPYSPRQYQGKNDITDNITGNITNNNKEYDWITGLKLVDNKGNTINGL